MDAARGAHRYRDSPGAVGDVVGRVDGQARLAGELRGRVSQGVEVFEVDHGVRFLDDLFEGEVVADAERLDIEVLLSPRRFHVGHEVADLALVLDHAVARVAERPRVRVFAVAALRHAELGQEHGRVVAFQCGSAKRGQLHSVGVLVLVDRRGHVDHLRVLGRVLGGVERRHRGVGDVERLVVDQRVHLVQATACLSGAGAEDDLAGLRLALGVEVRPGRIVRPGEHDSGLAL